jgi:hypothetical protein
MGLIRFAVIVLVVVAMKKPPRVVIGSRGDHDGMEAEPKRTRDGGGSALRKTEKPAEVFGRLLAYGFR